MTPTDAQEIAHLKAQRAALQAHLTPAAPSPRQDAHELQKQLRRLVRDRERLEDHTSYLVAAARERGWSWEKIGRLLEVTGETLRRRHG